MALVKKRKTPCSYISVRVWPEELLITWADPYSGACCVQPLCVVLFSGTSDCRTSYGISDRASCTGTDRASAFSDRKISRVEHLFA